MFELLATVVVAMTWIFLTAVYLVGGVLCFGVMALWEAVRGWWEWSWRRGTG